MVSHAVAFETWHRSLCLRGLALCKRSFFAAWLRHARACSGLCNLAQFIVPMLACIVQAQLLHRWAVACCRMRLLGNLAQFTVPMLACIVQAQLLHSKAVACCRMRLQMQPGTFQSAYAGLRQASAASSQQCCGMLSRAVAHATWHIS